MIELNVNSGTAFRRADGEYFVVVEVFEDGWVAGDLLFDDAPLFPQAWLELGPDDLAQMTRVPPDKWREKIRAFAITRGYLTEAYV